MIVRKLIALTIAGLLFISCKNEKMDYSYKIKIEDKQIKWFAGEWNGLRLAITNNGSIPWVVAEDNITWRVRASYHLFDSEGRQLVSDGIRTDFLETVRPGETIRITLGVFLPPDPGRYLLQIDLLKEGKVWFKDIGNKPPSVIIDAVNPLDEVKISVSEKDISTLDVFIARAKEMNSRFLAFIPYPELAYSLSLIKRNYEKNFIDSSKGICGYYAGSNYPQIWLRDSYYHCTAGSYLYPLERARKTIEMFLKRVNVRREIVPDYVTPEGKIKTFSIMNDGPAFLILMSCDYLLQSGDYEWLKKKVGDSTVYSLLSSIVEKIFKRFFDDKSGLFWSSHTADWGDVEFEDEGADSLYFGRSSHKVGGIYLQSLYFAALSAWAKVLYSSHLYQSSMENSYEADVLRSRTDESLWDESKGNYRIHHHITPLNHIFNEDEIFALGGNIWAISAGLSDREHTQRILDKVKAIKESNGFITISKVLHPPYPEYFFKHPALSNVDTYQNGGFWDWYGAMAVLEEFRAGRYESALTHLREIAGVIQSNKNIYEWYDSTGKGKGSTHFLASGAAVLDALIRGYFGLRLENGKWRITPSYDSKIRCVYFHRKETGLTIAYKINQVSEKTVTLDYLLEGQDSFDMTLPVAKLNTDEYQKKMKVLDRKLFFYDVINNYLCYRTTLNKGRGAVRIEY